MQELIFEKKLKVVKNIFVSVKKVKFMKIDTTLFSANRHIINHAFMCLLNTWSKHKISNFLMLADRHIFSAVFCLQPKGVRKM